MTVLAFDTATPATAVALCDDSRGLVLEARDDPPRGVRPRHATRLLPLIDELLGRFARAAGVPASLAAVDSLAVGTGPGTFTGLRIGIATARALARARKIPLAGVSTLRSLALNASCTEASADVVVAVLDARRGEVFAAAWEAAAVAAGEPLLAPAALAPERLAEIVSGLGRGVQAMGDGAVEFRGILEHSGITIPGDESALHRVSAINHCRLAGTAPATPPDRIEPEYLRIPDAEITRRAKASQ